MIDFQQIFEKKQATLERQAITASLRDILSNPSHTLAELEGVLQQGPVKQLSSEITLGEILPRTTRNDNAETPPVPPEAIFIHAKRRKLHLSKDEKQAILSWIKDEVASCDGTLNTNMVVERFAAALRMRRIPGVKLEVNYDIYAKQNTLSLLAELEHSGQIARSDKNTKPLEWHAVR